jgi:PAS domain S-box-containing protein
VAGAELGWWLSFRDVSFATFWPPAGLYFATLLSTETRRWPWFLGAAGLGALISNCLIHGQSAWVCLAFWGSGTLQHVLGAWFLRMVLGDNIDLGRLKDVVVVGIVAVLLCALVAAPLNAALIVSAALADSFGTTWQLQRFSLTMGILVVSPVVLHWVFGDPATMRKVRPMQVVEGIVCLTGMVASAVVCFSGEARFALSFPFLPYPFALWAALRLCPRGTATGLFFTALVAIGFTSYGIGPFAAAGVLNWQASVALQLYVAITSVSFLVLAAVIFQQRAAEEALRTGELRLRNIVESATDGIVTISEMGIIESFNSAASRMFGYTPDEASGLNISLLMPEPFAAQHDNYLAAYKATRIKRMIGLERELVARRKDGTVFPVELAVSEMHEEGITKFSGIVRDITDRKRLEERFHYAQKMDAITRLAGGVAHDFNNILTVIASYCDLTLDGLSPENPLRKYVQEIRAAVDRSVELTRQLLTFSRSKSLETKVIDLNLFIGQREKILARMLGESNRLVLELVPESCTVRADVTQLEQVLVNLSANARDAMPSGGVLTIRTRVVDLDNLPVESSFPKTPRREVHFEVIDTGHGMDPETRAHLFEPFFTTKEMGRGTGLGLATVFGVVARYGGSIDVKTAPGEGTAFCVRLPFVDDAAPVVGPARLPTAHQGKKVLVVEEEGSVRLQLKGLLESHGYTVFEARNGREGLQYAIEHLGTIDLLITDMVLPFLSGRQLARQLKARFEHLRILYLSTAANDALLREEDDDHTAHLPSTYTPNEFIECVERLLGERVEELPEQRDPAHLAGPHLVEPRNSQELTQLPPEEPMALDGRATER